MRLRGLPREEFDETLLWCWSVEEGREFIWNAKGPSWSWSSTNRGVGYLSDVVLLDSPTAILLLRGRECLRRECLRRECLRREGRSRM